MGRKNQDCLQTREIPAYQQWYWGDRAGMKAQQAHLKSDMRALSLRYFEPVYHSSIKYDLTAEILQARHIKGSLMRLCR